MAARFNARMNIERKRARQGGDIIIAPHNMMVQK